MHDVEMRPHWWRYAIQAAGMARREIRRMHPNEREHHDLTVDDCNDLILKIRESGAVESDEKWPTVELTDTDVSVLWQGLIGIVSVRRGKTPENYKPATRWAKARGGLPAEHSYVRESLPSLDRD